MPDAGNGVHVDAAVDWLLNSRYLDPPVVDHFWHVADGVACDCREAGRIAADD